MGMFQVRTWALIGSAGLLFIGGCGVDTRTIDRWQHESPPPTNTYDPVFVVSLAEDPRTKEWVERALAEALREQGVRALVATDHMKHAPDAPANEVEAALEAATTLTGAEAVLVSTVQNQAVELDAVDPTAAPIVKSHPDGPYYDSLSLYWLHQNQVLNPPAAGPSVTVRPGPATRIQDRSEHQAPNQEPMEDYELKHSYQIETALFDVATQQPVWVAETRTEEAEDVQQAFNNYAVTVVRALGNDEWIESTSLPE